MGGQAKRVRCAIDGHFDDDPRTGHSTRKVRRHDLCRFEVEQIIDPYYYAVV